MFARRGRLWRRSGGGIAYPPLITLSTPLDTIGDVSTANAGIRLPGTGFTRGDGSSIVQAAYFGESLATVTATTPTQLTLTSPSLTIGAYDIRVVDLWGRETVVEDAWDAWSPASTSPLYLFRAGFGENIVAEKIATMTNLGTESNPLTFAVQPNPSANDANFGNRPAISLASGCYGSVAGFSSVSIPWTMFIVGLTPNAAGYRLLAAGTPADGSAGLAVENTTNKWYLSGGVSVLSTGEPGATASAVVGSVVSGGLDRVRCNTLTATEGSAGDTGLTGLAVGANTAGSYRWNGTFVLACLWGSNDTAVGSYALRWSNWWYGTDL